MTSSSPDDLQADSLSSDQLAADEAKLRQQIDELYKMGFRPCNFRDESEAPPVDEQLLLRLVRRELPEKIAALVYRLVYSYQSWHTAFSRLVREGFAKSNDECRISNDQ